MKTYKVLSLDGGGAKGFYTLGILDEMERNSGRSIFQSFDLIFGTSTGAIIAALLARGESASNVLKLYSDHVPAIMTGTDSKARSIALQKLATEIFGRTRIDDFKTGIGIVATNWKEQVPLIFKNSDTRAFAGKGSFVPFHGCTIAEAVISSCSAYPLFDTYTVTNGHGDKIEAADGGFCANNPALYALADAVKALKQAPQDVRLVSLGVGVYPEPSFFKKIKLARGGWPIIRHSLNVGFVQKLLGTNTSSMDQLRKLLFSEVPTIRISDTFSEPDMATDLMEHDLDKLNRLTQKGRKSYRDNELTLLEFMNA